MVAAQFILLVITAVLLFLGTREVVKIFDSIRSLITELKSSIVQHRESMLTANACVENSMSDFRRTALQTADKMTNSHTKALDAVAVTHAKALDAVAATHAIGTDNLAATAKTMLAASVALENASAAIATTADRLERDGAQMLSAIIALKQFWVKD